MEVVGEGGRGWGKGGVGVGWGVGKQGERKEGDLVMPWCSFWLWTRSNWMPFPLLFEAAVWPSVWPCLLVQAWSGMRLLFDRWSHDNRPRWASLDKPILCLHIPCVDSRTGVSSSRRLLPCSSPKVQSAPQWWHAWLCRTISQCLVIPGYALCDVGSVELLLGQQPSSSPLQLRGTFALVVCWLVEVGPLLLGGNWCMVLCGLLVSHPTLGFSYLCQYGQHSVMAPCVHLEWALTGWKNMPQGPSCRLAHHAVVISCEGPLLVVSRVGKEVVGGAKRGVP